MNKLEIELNEYLKTTPVNEEELAALKEWVADGNSVHSNPSMVTDEHGNPMDFLFDYRYHAEIYKELEHLSGKEKQIYLARLRGEETTDTLWEDLCKAVYERNVYYQVLKKHGFLEEAELRIEQGRKLTFKSKTNLDEELPFQ